MNAEQQKIREQIELLCKAQEEINLQLRATMEAMKRDPSLIVCSDWGRYQVTQESGSASPGSATPAGNLESAARGRYQVTHKWGLRYLASRIAWNTM